MADLQMYDSYEHLLFERREHGILWITINRPERFNATNNRLHWELSRVWLDVTEDRDTRVAVITGAGKAFSAGGDFELIAEQTGNFNRVQEVAKEAADIVYNIADCSKPVISAINGVAVGAGLVVALMADISYMATEARLTDGHTRLGVAAGDHAVILWPLLCGLAKARYYLMTCDFVDGAEAERIGLVSKAVPLEQLHDAAMECAVKLATGPQSAIRWTKRSLNLWLKQAAPQFEASLAYEMLGFFSDDVREGAAAIQERRNPSFPSTR
ncbi:MAG: enoyl-CoA hydratase/isomerase family protein [Acidimicrobiia bacterium]